MLAKPDKLNVTKAHSREQNAAAAVSEIKTQLGDTEKSVVVLFCSSTYDLKELGREIKSSFDCPVIGCTTSGELGPLGYDEFSISGFGINCSKLEVFPHVIGDLSHFKPDALTGVARGVTEQIAAASARISGAKAFGFLLIDGMSVKEEQVIGNLYAMLHGIPIFGGSAGDDLKFERTHVYHDGEFKSDAASFALFVTSLPFEIFKTQHFEPTEKKLVVTKADPEHRVVYMLNGRPAADEYARICGTKVEDMCPQMFSENPVMLKIGGEYYVRSIQKANPDHSLSFYCAIDKGVVLTVGVGVNILENLESTLSEIERRTNSTLIIGCECILRRLEVLHKDISQQAGRIMARHNVIGFHTYGEQFNSVHVNQTFTGVAIGERA